MYTLFSVVVVYLLCTRGSSYSCAPRVLRPIRSISSTCISSHAPYTPLYTPYIHTLYTPPIHPLYTSQVVHRIVYAFCKMSGSLQPTCIVKALRKVRAVVGPPSPYLFPLSLVLGTPPSKTKSADLLGKLGLSPSHLLQGVEDSYAYEHLHSSNIIKLLESVGWNMKRFMYGTIQNRVEW
jgi:hypothetical protein